MFHSVEFIESFELKIFLLKLLHKIMCTWKNNIDIIL